MRPETHVRKFWNRVAKSEGCWLWTGSKHSLGYGTVRWLGKLRSTHRVAYELARGPIPTGMSVLHSCDVRNCVNPAHLRVGTQQENVADREARGRGAHQRNRAQASLPAVAR